MCEWKYARAIKDAYLWPKSVDSIYGVDCLIACVFGERPCISESELKLLEKMLFQSREPRV